MKQVIGFALASAFSASTLADDVTCQPVSGTINVASEGLQCTILTLPRIDKRYPDVQFLAEAGLSGTCLTGTFNGFIGLEPVTGVFYSGLTFNAFEQPDPRNPTILTAATVVSLTSDKKELRGTLYYQDVFVAGPEGTREKLTLVDGDKPFEKHRSSLFILGNVLDGAPVDLIGQLCKVK